MSEEFGDRAKNWFEDYPRTPAQQVWNKLSEGPYDHPVDAIGNTVFNPRYIITQDAPHILEDLDPLEANRLFYLVELTTLSESHVADQLRNGDYCRRLGLSDWVSQPTINRLCNKLDRGGVLVEHEAQLLGELAVDTEYEEYFKTPEIAVPDGSGPPEITDISRKLRRLVYPRIKFARESSMPKDRLLKIVTTAALYGCFPNVAAKARRTYNFNWPEGSPDAATLFQHIWPQSRTEIVASTIAAQEMLYELAAQYAGNEYGEVVLACDLTDWSWYGVVDDDRPEYVGGAKPSSNSSYAWRFASISVVGTHAPLTLAALPVRTRKNRHYALDRLLTHATTKFDVDRVLVDSEFYGTKEREVLAEHDVDAVMQAKEQASVIGFLKDGAMAYDLPYNDVDWNVGSFDPDEYGQDDDTLFVIPEKKASERRKEEPDDPRDDWTTFYTTYDPDDVDPRKQAHWYRQRWGIETKYRVMKHRFLPQSASSSIEVRTFLANFAMILYNMWTVANLMGAARDADADLEEEKVYSAVEFAAAITNDPEDVETYEIENLSEHSDILAENKLF